MTLYTYRCGDKVSLRKDDHRFTVLTTPGDEALQGLDVQAARRDAHHGVVVKSADCDADMQRVRSRRVAHHLYFDEATAQPWPMTDEILVTFEPAGLEEALSRMLADYSLTVVRRLGDHDYVLRLTNKTEMNPVKLVVELNESTPPGVTCVEHNLRHRASTASAPTPSHDPHYAKQWHLHTHLQHPEVDPRSSARCEDAWDLLGNTGDSEVTICVFDDGCRMDHIDFDSPSKFRDWAYFDGEVDYGHVVWKKFTRSTDPSACPKRMYSPGNDHGTACCGVAAAELDGQLTVGAAPGCKLLPIKALAHEGYLYFDDADLIDVIDFMCDKADIMSNSWGQVPVRSFSKQVLDRIHGLRTKGGRRGRGVVFLWAAGNENCPLNYAADIDVPYTNGWVQHWQDAYEWYGPDTARIFRNNLADHPGVLHVAALASTAMRSHYSNYGLGIDLCAPSSNKHAYDRLTLQGLDVTTVEGIDLQATTDRFGGTSSATPLVAGIAALVISANHDLHASDVRDVLLQTASRDLDFTGYPKTPPAKYDPEPSWDVSPIQPFDSGTFDEDDWSPWFGHGKVDAEAAVRRALKLLVETTTTPTTDRFDLSATVEEALYDDLHLDASSSAIDPARDPLFPTHQNFANIDVTLTTPQGTPAPGVTIRARSRPLTLAGPGWRTRDGLASRWPPNAARTLRDRIDQGWVRLAGTLVSDAAVTNETGQAQFRLRAWHVCGNEERPATDRVTFTWPDRSQNVDIACGVRGLDPLPDDPSAGVVAKKRREPRYARIELVQLLRSIGAAWRNMNKPPGMPDFFTVTDASYRWGGLIPPHLTHRFGAAVDLRPISTDGQPTSITAANYSKPYTAALIDLVARTRATEIIFGEQLAGVTKVRIDHKDHIHVSWRVVPSEPWRAASLA